MLSPIILPQSEPIALGLWPCLTGSYGVAPDGIFSAKLFWASFQTSHTKLKWAQSIWSTWVPPKVSAFCWKLFHKVVPTDDNISKLGIPLVSRCVCCERPGQETANHLFFNGTWGRSMWRMLSNIFHLRKVHGLEKVWVQAKPGTFMDCLSMGMMACGLWVLWGARNKLIYDGRAVDWQRQLLGWATKLSYSHISFINHMCHQRSMRTS
ncbi:hypothetical protein QQ045_031705 [Rhodiola kirilowii]